jgi:hypothetical protein
MQLVNRLKSMEKLHLGHRIVMPPPCHGSQEEWRGRGKPTGEICAG